MIRSFRFPEAKILHIRLRVTAESLAGMVRGAVLDGYRPGLNTTTIYRRRDYAAD